MEILEIELENIKSYVQARIPFRGGVNAIVGHNGAGKSTVLEAIGFALFDFLGYKAADFLREGTRTGAVAVTFLSSYDERPYRVERRLGGSHAYLVHDVELQAKVCEGKSDVLAFVRRHSGADPTVDLAKLFADAIGVPQGSLTAIFLATAALRKNSFETLLQVEEYQRAVERLREAVRLLGDQQQALAQEGAVYAARLERLPALTAAVAQRTRDLAAAQARQAEVAAQLQTTEAQKNALESVRTTLNELALRAARLGEQAQMLTHQLETTRRGVAEAQAAQAIVTAHTAGHQAYGAAQARKAALDGQVRERQQLLQVRASAAQELALAAADMERTRAQLREIEAAEATVLALAPAVARQDELEASLAAAQQAAQRLATLSQQRQRQEKRLADLQARRQTLADQLTRAAALTKALAASEQTSSQLRLEIDEHKQRQTRWKTEADTIKQQTTALENPDTTQCPLCEQPLSEEHRTQMLTRNENQLLHLRSQYSAAQAALRAAEETLAALETTTREQRSQLLAMPRAAQLEELDRDSAGLAQEVAALRAEEAALTASPAQLSTLAAALADLENPRQRRAVAAAQAAQRKQVETHSAQLAGRLQQAQAEQERVGAALTAFAELDDALAAVQDALVAHEPAHQAVLSHRAVAATAATKVAELTQQEELLQQLKVQLAAVQAETASSTARFDADAYAGILGLEKSLREDYGSLLARSELLRQEQGRDEAEVAVLHGEESRLAAVQAQQRTLSRQVAALDSIRSLLKQAGPYITAAVVRQVGAGAAQIFGEIMQDYSRQLNWDEDFGISLQVDGATRQFAQLSGGEQMSAALAVRLALVREMSKLDVAFFDEPTANLDDQRREALAQQIMNIRGFRQLFVISHDDTFEQATQNLIRIRRQGATSVVIRDETL